MADLKISQMTDGGDVQSTDEIPVARSGDNYKVKVGTSAALDFGTGPDDVPKNSDLGDAAYAELGTGPTQVPTNADITATGFVTGPASSTDNAIARYDSTTGKIIQNSTATLSDAGLLTATSFAGAGTGLTGTASSLSIGGNAATASTASTVTTNANLTGAITSTGNATALGSFTSAQLLAALTDETGTGANMFATGPTFTLKQSSAPTPTTEGAIEWDTDDDVIVVGDGASQKRFPSQSAATSYTPTWTGSTTNPVLGNGAITGSYIRQGDLVHVSLALVIGSTTTQGTGYWLFSVPLTVSGASKLNGLPVYAICAGVYRHGMTLGISTSTVACIINAGSLWGVGQPGVWATGETVQFNFVYRL